MKITKANLRRIIQEEKARLIKEMANQEQDFVVGGYSGGYSSNSERYDYIVSAIDKNDAKKKLKAAKPHLRKINATPVTDYTQFNPHTTFKRLGESVNFSRGDQVKITKSELRRIIKEEKQKLLKEMHPRAAADNAYMDVLEAVDELITALRSTNLGVDQGREDDEVYIMTGASEGITVKVVRRGR